MVLISIVNELFRGLPALGPSFLLIYYNYNNDIMLLYIFMGSIFILFINFIMKDIIFKYIEYIINYYNFTNLKLICGTFERPPEAKNCGIVYLNEKNFSYERGMPSGHSLVAAYLATCLYFYIIHKYKIKKKNHTNLFTICLLFTFYTMYTRILFGCHTFQQTIVGSIIGTIYGYYYYNLSYKFINT